MIAPVMAHHLCNAYCDGAGLHCELYYADAGATEAALRQALGYYKGLRVERCERAREAPPAGTWPAEIVALGSRPADVPWLVWWR